MALNVNVSQINLAAGKNQPLRDTLVGIHLALQSLYAQTGSAPLQKVDATANKFSGPPPQCGLSVTGSNGQFLVSITLPQQASGSSAPQNASNAPIYQELSSSPVANFSSGVVVYPLSTSTNFTFQNPGATLFWRIRSSYNQTTFNNYQVQPGSVSAGLQTSAATQPNVSLNQSNFATIDSVANGSTATVRIYGNGGPGTSWSRISGSNSQVIPSGTILNVAYASNLFVAWTGSQYQVVKSLTQTFPDGWIPVGSVSVIANGAGLTLPTFQAILSGTSVIAIRPLTNGNGLTSPPVLTITGGAGSGATATCSISAGSVSGTTVTNPGTGYTSTPSVGVSGGVSAGAGGGGGANGSNGGRIFGLTAQGT